VLQLSHHAAVRRVVALGTLLVVELHEPQGGAGD
jgi:hypothetical protein